MGLGLHKALHETRVGLVDKPLRFRRDGSEHERGLAGTGDTGEHGEFPLRDIDAYVFEIIIARADNADEFLIVHLAILRRNPGPPRGRPGVIRG